MLFETKHLLLPVANLLGVSRVADAIREGAAVGAGATRIGADWRANTQFNVHTQIVKVRGNK